MGPIRKVGSQPTNFFDINKICANELYEKLVFIF